MTIQVDPAQLTASVYDAVAEGAWAPDDVAATVISEVRAGHSDVVATLWDLVAEGKLVYDTSPGYPSFRVASSPV